MIYCTHFQYLPDCHAFLGHIFLRVNWTPWLFNNIQQWDYATRNRILSTLLLMFVKLSYEPSVRENMQLLTLLQEAIAFPWYMLDYQGIEGTFDWFVMSTEPSSILCLNSEHSAVDNSILRYRSKIKNLKFFQIIQKIKILQLLAYFKLLQQ